MNGPGGRHTGSAIPVSPPQLLGDVRSLPCQHDRMKHKQQTSSVNNSYFNAVMLCEEEKCPKDEEHSRRYGGKFSLSTDLAN